ncbi:MAG TPA: hypothetical protein VFS38_00990, partial [Actinomycetota bacterium]|nr:hypothetical protein [Actinomycetota bacterium]
RHTGDEVVVGEVHSVPDAVDHESIFDHGSFLGAASRSVVNGAVLPLPAELLSLGAPLAAALAGRRVRG